MSHCKKTALSIAIVSTLFTSQAFSAERINVEHKSSLASSNVDIQTLLALSSELKGISGYASVIRTQKKLHLPGVPKKKNIQHHEGIEVYSVSVAANQADDGTFYNITGEYISGIGSDISSTTPTISVDVAVNKALGQAPKSIIKSDVYNIESKLYVWLDANDTAHLAWFISYVDTSATPSRPHLFIDAHTGEILDQWEGMNFADGTGPGGNERTGRYSYGPNGKYSSFQVTGSGNNCQLDSPNVITYDMNHQKSGGSVHTFPCYENTSRLVNGSYSALNDAHAFGQVTFGMFKDWYGKAPLSQKLKLRVHYDRNYENAFWDGQQMTFGDGQNTFHPLVGLGVVAHEVSHGFTQQNSNLRYENQSGGLNESFSDIAAAAVSFYLSGSFSWQIGDDIKKGSGAMRYMDVPSRDGRSIDHTRNYTTGMNVHFSSGVYNRAFYLLSTTAGWDIRKAFDVYIEANQTYWTANATFDSAGRGVYNSAKSLGYCVNDVIASLETVGVHNSGAKDGSGCGTTGNTAPVSNFTFSANKLDVNFSDSSSDDKGVVSYAWSFGDGSSSAIESPNHSYSNDGSYSVSLTVSDAEGLSNTKTKTVSVSAGDTNTGCDGVSQWSISSSYALGDVVSFNGYKYEAIWWSTGAQPDNYSNVWTKKAECSGDGGVDNKAPIANFSHSVNNLTVGFSDSSSDDKAVVSHSWNFGDGSSSTVTNPSHSYAVDGSYNVQLTVMDVEGLSATRSQTVTVSDGTDTGNCSATSWSANTVYNAGDKASQSGKEYKANWWSQDESPVSNSGQWQVWSLVADCK
jgi:vibriolysin